MMRRHAATVLLAGAVLVGCGTTAAVPVAAPVPVTAVPTTRAAAPTSEAPACPPSAWSCEQQQRFVAAEAYRRRAVGAHGCLSVAFTDRRTGAVWRSGDTTHEGWTASTIKLAIAADLLEHDRASLTAADRHDMDTMLDFSDEAASDRLWTTYGGDAMLARFRGDLGMTGLHVVPGFTRSTYWGFVTCTTDDLAALVSHVLDGPDRTYLVAAMRGVAPNQRWARPARSPEASTP